MIVNLNNEDFYRMSGENWLFRRISDLLWFFNEQLMKYRTGTARNDLIVVISCYFSGISTHNTYTNTSSSLGNIYLDQEAGDIKTKNIALVVHRANHWIFVVGYPSIFDVLVQPNDLVDKIHVPAFER
jgi:hypothetical protein